MSYVQTGSNSTRSIFLLVDQNLIQSESVWLLLNHSLESVSYKVIHYYSSQDHRQGGLMISVLLWQHTRHLLELWKLASRAAGLLPNGFPHILSLKYILSLVTESYCQVLEVS